MQVSETSIIKLLYADLGLNQAEIVDITGLPTTVVDLYIKEHSLVPAERKEETEADRIKRLEVIKQITFFPAYCTLENRIMKKIDDMLDVAGTADEVSKLTRAYKELRTVGVPPQLIEQAVKDGTGISVQILNSLS